MNEETAEDVYVILQCLHFAFIHVVMCCASFGAIKINRFVTIVKC